VFEDRDVKRIAIFQIRLACFKRLALSMSSSQNRCTVLRDMLWGYDGQIHDDMCPVLIYGLHLLNNREERHA
jgi:hypothetical protein